MNCSRGIGSRKPRSSPLRQPEKQTYKRRTSKTEIHPGRLRSSPHGYEKRLDIIEAILSALENRIGATASLLLDFPDTTSSFYSKLYETEYTWHDNTVVSLTNTGAVMRDHKVAGIWLVAPNTHSSQVYIIWQNGTRIDKLTSEADWQSLICQTDTFNFLKINGKRRDSEVER